MPSRLRQLLAEAPAQQFDHALLDKAAAKASSPTSSGPPKPVSYGPALAPTGSVEYAHALVPPADAAPSADKVIPGRGLEIFLFTAFHTQNPMFLCF